MKNKLIVVIAMLAMMVAITGIAAADPFNLNIDPGGPNPYIIAPSQTILLPVQANTFVTPVPTAAAPRWILLTAGGLLPAVECHPSNPCNTADIVVTIPLAGSGFWATSDPFVQAGAIQVTMVPAPLSAAGTKFNIHVTGNDTVNADITLSTRTVESVPEFPAIALPVAGVLGLVLFFQQRKIKGSK
jgi:hypothetical protein